MEQHGKTERRWKHRLLTKDESTMMGECAHCGIVELKFKHNRLKCVTAIREQRGNRAYGSERTHWYPSKVGGKTIRHSMKIEMFENSSKTCGICSSPLNIENAKYDHCHNTGAHRGWLCGKCNTGLGMLGDDEEGLMKALNYLKTGAL